MRSFLRNSTKRLHFRNKKTGAFNKDYRLIEPTDTNLIPRISSNHNGIDVLEREGNNIVRAPKAVKDKFMATRTYNNELSIIPHYGTSAKYNSRFVNKTLREHMNDVKSYLSNHPDIKTNGLEVSQAIPLGPVK